MRLLAIESSCDETCAAVMIKDRLVSNVVASQDIHHLYGGVVPELASRAHLQHIKKVVDRALDLAGVQIQEIDGLAVTYGPGLVGSLLVGLSFAKGLALNFNLPLLGINHLEGHLFSTNIEDDGPEPPFLSLIISGGHTILTYVKSWGQYEILGETQDDAAGEAFDKVAKILDLPYPGGPAVEELSRNGNPKAVKFPIAKLKDAPFYFSFSGLKTAVLYYVQKNLSKKENKTEHLKTKSDIASSFQYALIAALIETTARAYNKFPVRSVALAGGVACNKALRKAMTQLGKELNFRVHFPKPVYCTDNAAMIARAASFYYNSEKLDISVNKVMELSPKPGLTLATASVIPTS